MKKSMIPILLASLLALAACSPDPQPVIQQPVPQVIAAPTQAAAPAAPVIINQAPASSGADAGDMLAAGAVGMLAGQALAGGGSRGYDNGYRSAPVVHRTTVVNKTKIVVKQAPPAPRVNLSKSSSRSSSSFSRSYSRSGRR